MLTAALTGYGTAFSLILAIGAQNAFVLREGLMRVHVFWLCLLCALSDALALPMPKMFDSPSILPQRAPL